MNRRDAHRTAMAARRTDPAVGYGRRAGRGWRAGTGYTDAELSTAARMADRILGVVALATPTQRAEGMAWYGVAHAEAVAAGRALGLDAAHAVAALAVASPGRAWTTNVAALATVAELRRNPSDPMLAREVAARHGLSVGRTGYAPLMRAAAILVDTDPWRALAVLTGPKVTAFGHAVMTSGATAHVAVDGHAIACATLGVVPERPSLGNAPSMTGRGYDVAALAYATAALAYGVTPPTLQAIAWLAWRAIPTGRR